MTRRRLPDVALVRPVDGGFGFRCNRCAAELVISAPVLAPELVGVSRDFLRRHRPCQQAQAAEDRGEA